MIINSLFASLKLNSKGVASAQKIETLFSTLYAELQVLCTDGREFSLVKTKLEEASMYAKKSLSLQEKNTIADPTPAPSAGRYIVEVYVNAMDKWVRSANPPLTVAGKKHLGEVEFPTVREAQREADAQARSWGLTYRINAVKTKQYIVQFVNALGRASRSINPALTRAGNLRDVAFDSLEAAQGEADAQQGRTYTRCKYKVAELPQ